MGKSVVTVTRQNRGKLVHIEAPGCVVNVRVGLKDDDGHEVTSIEVLADGAKHAGQEWWIHYGPDYGSSAGRRNTGSSQIRVRRDK